jgi:hypothetical protein
MTEQFIHVSDSGYSNLARLGGSLAFSSRQLDEAGCSILTRFPSVSKNDTYRPTPGICIGFLQALAAGFGHFLHRSLYVIDRNHDRGILRRPFVFFGKKPPLIAPAFLGLVARAPCTRSAICFPAVSTARTKSATCCADHSRMLWMALAIAPTTSPTALAPRRVPRHYVFSQGPSVMCGITTARIYDSPHQRQESLGRRRVVSKDRDDLTNVRSQRVRQLTDLRLPE